jgi:hypothetical protein
VKERRYVTRQNNEKKNINLRVNLQILWNFKWNLPMIQILINAGGTIHVSIRLPLAQKINSDLKREFNIAHLNLVSKRQLVYHGSIWSHDQ